MSVLDTILVCTGGIVFYVLYCKLTDFLYGRKFDKAEKKANVVKEKKIRKTCYHTTLDCENCINFTRCTQHYGEGLVRNPVHN